MLFAKVNIVLACLGFAAAAPLEKKSWGDSFDDLFLSILPNNVLEEVSGTNILDAQMPAAPTALPTPDPSLQLFQVAIGVGTQNYSCATNDSSSTPSAVGALATLYNATEVAATCPETLSKLPGLAMAFNNEGDVSRLFHADVTGHHYFLNTTTPFFSVNISPHQHGTGAFSKVAVSDAPSNSIKGPQDKGYGAVQWLYLQALPGMAQPIKAVYRLNTAGGDPPTTCEGQPPAIEMPYAAEYWLYM